MSTQEHCFLCSFWKDERCTQTWRLLIHIEPHGGQVDFSTTPGMVPEELKAKVTQYFGELVERFLLPLIDKMPVWNEIREFQAASPVRTDCPGRRERQDLKPFLKVVK